MQKKSLNPKSSPTQRTYRRKGRVNIGDNRISKREDIVSTWRMPEALQRSTQ
jgi:hypothetical protein